MNTFTYMSFVSSLIKATKSQKIKWIYLDTDVVAESIIESQKDVLPLEVSIIESNPKTFYFQSKKYRKDKCFCAWLNNDVDLLLFLVSETGTMELIVAAGASFKTSTIISDTQFGVDLVQLLAVIRKQFPDPETVMENFIKDFSNLD